MKRGKRARRKSTCPVNLSSWLVCQVELVTASGICHLRKYFAGVSRQIFFRIAIASEKVFARFFGPFFACCRLSKKRVFGLTRCEIWLSHNPPSTSFSRYKQSRSNIGSTQKIAKNIISPKTIGEKNRSDRFWPLFGPWPWPDPPPSTPQGGFLSQLAGAILGGSPRKLTWQVDLTSCHLSSDLKRGRRRGWQGNLTSTACQVDLSSSTSGKTQV